MVSAVDDDGWARTPWLGHVVVRGPRGSDRVDERLDRRSTRHADGVRVGRWRTDGVKVWRRDLARGHRESLLPVLRGRVVDDGSRVEIRAFIRPAWTAWLNATYAVGFGVGGMAAAIQSRTLFPLLYMLVPGGMSALALRQARRYRADVEAAERVLCSLVAGQVVERHVWRPRRRSRPAPPRP